jgi:hypothetical protein
MERDEGEGETMTSGSHAVFHLEWQENKKLPPKSDKKITAIPRRKFE